MFKEIEKGWTQGAASYDDIVKKQLSNRRDVRYWTRELQALTGKNRKKILEIGCGPGFISIILSRLGHKVKPIDGSIGMLSCANNNFRAEGLTITAQEEDGVTLPDEENNTYDYIISRDVVWTLYDPEQAFQRWKEVLKPGGKILYYDGNYTNDYRTFGIRCWHFLSNLLILLTERKNYFRSRHRHGEAQNALPFPRHKRPEHDLKILKKVGFTGIYITDDAYRNSPSRMEYWKYGYQGKKFRVIAEKEI